MGACAAPSQERVDLATAENFIDAFYSFNQDRLKAALTSASASMPKIVYYQGWAKGGNYKIVSRMPCKQDGAASVSCPITVKDDLMAALGIAFDVTDTFHLSFSDGKITAVKTSSNDLPVYEDAYKWVMRERPELVRIPCEGLFDGGPTPAECAQAMARGYADFARSKDFPREVVIPR